MSKNIFIKSLVCITFIVILSSTFCLPVSHAVGDIFSQGKGFLEAGNDVDDTLDIGELQDTSNYIYNALLGIAIMVAIIVAMVLGIQFMAASADEKAKVKEAILPFVVGCIVVFGAFTIWKIAVNIGNDAEGSVTGYSSAASASIATSDITDGKVKVEQLSDEQIKDLYSNNRISSELRNKMYGTAQRPKKKEDYLTVDQALNQMGDTVRKIYNQAKKRGLLKAPDYIDLK